MSVAWVATVAVEELDAAEARLRDGPRASALPDRSTSEGRQLRRWLTQLLVTERVIAAEAAARGLTGDRTPSEAKVLLDLTARLEIGSVAAAVLADPRARALYADVTIAVEIGDDDVAAYHARNPLRFAEPSPDRDGWRTPSRAAPPLARVRPAIAGHLLGALGVAPSGCAGCAACRARPARRGLRAHRRPPPTPTGTERICLPSVWTLVARKLLRA